MKKTALIALTVLLAAACGKEIVPDNTVSDGTVTLQAGFVQDGTKVNVSDAGALTWKEGDQIAVWTSNGSDGKFVTFTLKDGAGSNTASFTGTPDTGYNPGSIAVYPAAAAKSWSSEILTVNYPDSYNYDEGRENVRMAAWFTDASAGLQFDHIGGMVRFSINNIPASANSFKLVSSKTATGDFSVGASRTAEASAGESTVTISFTAGSIASGTFNVPVPVGDGYSFTAGLYKDGTAIEKTLRSTTKNIARKDYLQMKAYTVSDTWYVKPDGTGHGSSWADATSLEKALAGAEDGETIKMAAGSYSASSIPELYSDAALTTPVTTEEWKVFVITSNVTIEGGYAGSSESETPNYTANATIIDGSAGAAHGLAVAAPKAEGKKVSVKGIKITNFTSPSNNNPARTKDNVYLAGSYGSAIVARGTEVEFEQCIITGNTATAGGKCTVYGAGDGAIITFKDCTISGNTADNGAAANAHGTTVNFTGSTTISGNTAAANLLQTDATGVVIITDNTTITGNTVVNIINNTAVGGQTTLSGNAVINNNTATVVVTNKGTFNMSGNAVISGHSAITNAIANTGTVELSENASITNNTATSYLVDNSATFTASDDVCFTGNTASAILRLAESGTMEFNGNVTIANNNANKAIRNEGGTFIMTGGQIYGNVSNEATGVLFNKGTATLTGVDIYHNSGTYALLYNYNSTSLTISGCDIYENTMSATSPGSLFWNNSILYINQGTKIRDHKDSYSLKGAGGVFFNKKGLISVDNAWITGNSSSSVGVIIQSSDNDGNDTYSYFTNCLIKGNSGTQRGLYLRENSHSVIANCTIYDNSFTSTGGAIVLYGVSGKQSTAYIVNSTITKNTTDSANYPAIQNYNDYTELYLYNTVATGNIGGTYKDMDPDHVGVKAKAYCALGYGESNYGKANIYGSESTAVLSAQVGYAFGGVIMPSFDADKGVIPITERGSLRTKGMPYDELTAIPDPFGKGILTAEILGKDQLGNSRSGLTYIGAYVGE